MIMQTEEFAASQQNVKSAIEVAKDLVKQLKHYMHINACSAARKTRCELLMERKSANGWRMPNGRTNKGWSPAKKARMVRRFMTASQEFDQSTSAIQNISEKLRHLQGQ
jgi:hypothetical protein